MDDLFQGYIVLDALGDFLEDDALISHNKQPRMAPRPEQHARNFNHVSLTPQSELGQHDQELTTTTSAYQESSGLSWFVKKRGRHVQIATGVGVDVFKHARQDFVEPKVPSPSQVVRLSDTPIVYSPDDMQLFHHYLTAAYPSVPHDRDEIWYPYLMDAMLALAGSHLAVQVERPNNSLALRHRQRAIVGLEDAFARWPPSADESHVMFATSFLLSIQCSFIGDGFLEHFLSLRGCSLLSQLILTENFKGPFVEQSGLNLIPINMTFDNFIKVDQGLIREALLALKGFSHLVSRPDTHAIERAVVGQLVVALRCLLHSDTQSESGESAVPDLTDTTSISTEFSDSILPKNPLLPAKLEDNLQNIDWENIITPSASFPLPFTSFQAMTAILSIFATWPHEAILHIFGPKNHVGNIVMAHFSAIRFILSPLAAPRKSLQTPTKAVVQWLANIIATIDDNDESKKWAQYIEWPRKIARCMEACVEKNRGFTTGDVRDLFMRDPGAFREGRAPRF
ncbi:hypothetical protein yc1106_08526 [Curvularia clavata]|uniref:Uncharacterized protein n=1 Tax=Curvularia clavata TaxID=95742 RepID=A0A9Q8ZDG5_CURCL|nr:hypothetical protein yc1106_08526 [Curvularia clavata]